MRLLYSFIGLIIFKISCSLVGFPIKEWNDVNKIVGHANQNIDFTWHFTFIIRVAKNIHAGDPNFIGIQG